MKELDSPEKDSSPEYETEIGRGGDETSNEPQGAEDQVFPGPFPVFTG